MLLVATDASDNCEYRRFIDLLAENRWFLQQMWHMSSNTPAYKLSTAEQGFSALINALWMHESLTDLNNVPTSRFAIIPYVSGATLVIIYNRKLEEAVLVAGITEATSATLISLASEADAKDKPYAAGGQTLFTLAGTSVKPMQVYYQDYPEVRIVPPAPLDLKTAESFTMLAGTTLTFGTVATPATGDMGATALTAFAPVVDASGTFATSALLTSGKIYFPSYTGGAAKLTQAQLDWQSAYTEGISRDFSGNQRVVATCGGLSYTAGNYEWDNILTTCTTSMTLSAVAASMVVADR
ncbi:hypothetical protein T492DRAFT_834340 [Pavlovales sp. CCMP2436]|nr:hypothetical protein T492DRAFT_834340 [Pavlovales sp. CCMP2436]